MMKFDWKNREKIDDLYVHDSILKGYSYDYDQRTIKLNCDHYAPGFEIQFIFHNVIMSQMQSCRFWGNGVHVLVVCYDEENVLLKDLEKLQDEKKDSYRYSDLDKGIKYIPVVFEMNSGDVLTIICEAFEYEEFEKLGKYEEFECGEVEWKEFPK